MRFGLKRAFGWSSSLKKVYVLILDAIQHLVGIDGHTTTDSKDIVNPEPGTVNTSLARLDGSKNFISTPLSAITGGTVVNLSIAGHFNRITGWDNPLFSCAGTAALPKGFLWRIRDSGIDFVTAEETGGTSDIQLYTWPNVIPSIGWYDMKVTWSGVAGDVPELYIGNILQSGGSGNTINWTGNSTGGLEIGRYTTTDFLSAFLYLASYNDEFEYHFEEGAGDVAFSSLYTWNNGKYELNGGTGISEMHIRMDRLYSRNLELGCSGIAQFDGVNQYGDTGYVPNIDTEWEVEFFIGLGDTVNGIRIGTGKSLAFSYVGGNFAIGFGNNFKIHAGFDPLLSHKLIINKNGYTLDGSYVAFSNAPVFENTNNLSLTLGVFNTFDVGLIEYGHIGIYSSVIRQNGTVVQHLIPLVGKLRDIVGHTDAVLHNNPAISLIPASADDPTLDVMSRPLVHAPNTLHNGCDVSLRQDSASTGLLDTVDVNIYSDYTFNSNGEMNEKSLYVDGTRVLSWANTHWEVRRLTSLSTHPTATGQYPPKLGWGVYGGGDTIPIVNYNSNWIDDDGELISRDYINFITTANLTGNEILKFERKGAYNLPHLMETMHMKQDFNSNMTVEERDAIAEFLGDNAGVGVIEPLTDDNDNILYDSDGEVIFALPEGY